MSAEKERLERLYLEGHGWKPHGDLWLDPIMRRMEDTTGAVRRQQERDECTHPEVVTVEGQRVCNVCARQV